MKIFKLDEKSPILSILRSVQFHEKMDVINEFIKARIYDKSDNNQLSQLKKHLDTMNDVKSKRDIVCHGVWHDGENGWEFVRLRSFEFARFSKQLNKYMKNDFQNSLVGKEFFSESEVRQHIINQTTEGIGRISYRDLLNTKNSGNESKKFIHDFCYQD